MFLISILFHIPRVDWSWELDCNSCWLALCTLEIETILFKIYSHSIIIIVKYFHNYELDKMADMFKFH